MADTDLPVPGHHNPVAFSHGEDGGAVPAFGGMAHFGLMAVFASLLRFPCNGPQAHLQSPGPLTIPLAGKGARVLLNSGPSKEKLARKPMRQASISRKTTETAVAVTVSLDGTGRHDIKTGIGFLDHMLEQLARHSLIDLDITAQGDLHIDAHHTAEDTGIALGQAISQALGDRKGITRYGTAYVAMDEALSRVSLDISGRPYLVWKVAFPTQKLGDFDTELFREFFQALAQNSGITLNVENIDGFNSHHIAESCFKACARALRQAVEMDPRQQGRIPSTKGSLKG